MSDLNLFLLDTGENFILVSGDTETEFEYGKLALCLANSDYVAMNNLIVDFFNTNYALKTANDLYRCDKFGDCRISPEIINYILKDLYTSFYMYLAKEYLTIEQASIVSLLLLADIRSRLEDSIIDLNHPEWLMPVIFSDNNLHEYIKNILLKRKTAFFNQMQEKINQISLSSSFVTTENGATFQSYLITDIFDFIILDLHKYLLGKDKVNECKCCGKLFFPKYRNSEKYCSFNNSACKKKMKRQSQDNFIKNRDKFRAYQKSRIENESTKKQYSWDFLDSQYNSWSKECTQKYNDFKSSNNLQGFIDWFESTKFTANRLKQLFNEFNNKNNA